MIAGIKVRMYIMAKVCNSILVTIRQELYTHIQTLDFQFFDSRPTGKILARIIGDINSLKDVLSNCVTTLIPDFITICAVVIIMFAKNPILAAASLSSTPVMAICLWLIQIYSHKRWQIHRKKASNLNAFVHEDFSGIRIIQNCFPGRNGKTYIIEDIYASIIGKSNMVEAYLSGNGRNRNNVQRIFNFRLCIHYFKNTFCPGGIGD